MSINTCMTKLQVAQRDTWEIQARHETLEQMIHANSLETQRLHLLFTQMSLQLESMQLTLDNILNRP